MQGRSAPVAGGKPAEPPRPWRWPCAPAVRQATVQLPLPPGTLPLPEAVELQAHRQGQVQQRDEPQQLVACVSPRVLCVQAVDAELSRTPRGQSRDQLAQRLGSLAGRPPPVLKCLIT